MRELLANNFAFVYTGPNLWWVSELQTYLCLQATIQDKSHWGSAAIFIFFLALLSSLLNGASFSKISCSSPSPHPLQSWNSKKILDTSVQQFVGWGEGFGSVWIGKRPRNASVQECSHNILVSVCEQSRRMKILVTVSVFYKVVT